MHTPRHSPLSATLLQSTRASFPRTPLSNPKTGTATLFLIPRIRSPLSDNQVIQLHNGSSADEPQPAYSFEEIVKSSEDREMMEVRFLALSPLLSADPFCVCQKSKSDVCKKGLVHIYSHMCL